MPDELQVPDSSIGGPEASNLAFLPVKIQVAKDVDVKLIGFRGSEFEIIVTLVMRHKCVVYHHEFVTGL